MAIIFVIYEQFTKFPILSFRFLALLIFWKKWTILLFEIDNEICFRAGRNSPLAVKGESHESANPMFRAEPVRSRHQRYSPDERNQLF